METVATVSAGRNSYPPVREAIKVARDYDYRRYDSDRGTWEKAGDEVRSWFGDEEAERRRRFDEMEEQRMMDSGERYGRGEGYSRRFRQSRRAPRDEAGGILADDSERGGRFVGDDYPEERYGLEGGMRNYESQGRGRYGGQSGQYSSQGSRFGSRYGEQSMYGGEYGRPYGGQSSSEFSGERSAYGGSRDMPRYMRHERNEPSDLGWRSGSYGGRYQSGSEDYGGMRGSRGRSSLGSSSFESGSYGMPANRGRGPSGYQRSDSRIEEDVHEALTWDDDVDATHIQVKVENGEVTLTGTVKDRWEKRAAEDALDDIRGLRDVHNQLRVEEREHMAQGSSMASGSGTSGTSSASGTSGTSSASGGSASGSTSGSTSGRSGSESSGSSRTGSGGENQDRNRS
jgi:osmotically-inducible protein OsmY